MENNYIGGVLEGGLGGAAIDKKDKCPLRRQVG